MLRMQEIAKGKINTRATQETNAKQETNGAVKCCASTDSISKSTNNNTKLMVDTNLNTNRFFQGQAVIQTKEKVLN